MPNHTFDQLALVHLPNYPRRNSHTLSFHLNCRKTTLPFSSTMRAKFFYLKFASPQEKSKIFPPAKLSYPQIITILEIFKDFCLQNCLSRKSSLSWKYSKSFSPAKMPQPQIINILEIFKDYLACNFFWAANHQYPGNIQRLFCLQNCLSRKSIKSWKFSKTFSPVKLS